MQTSGEFRAATEGAAWVLRTDRSMLRVTGKDRATWLHNLVTNHVKTVGVGEGNYAFALNVKGRILFDLNLLVRDEDILLDLDRRWVEPALKHFGKYIIMEDVQVAEAAELSGRAALVGPGAPAALATLGCPQAARMALLGAALIHLADAQALVFRSDFCGVHAFELVFAPQAGPAILQHLAASARSTAGESAAAVSMETLEILRIEAGFPSPGAELNEDVVPAETGQLARAVNFNKGCYLGQEVVERMHARNVVSRLLTGLLLEGQDVPPRGAGILDAAGANLGQVTSACYSPALDKPIALSYVKAAAAKAGTPLLVEWEGRRVRAMTALPTARGRETQH
ncbi:MAG: folate-binding protein YgfZ [Phycisphaerales bacterium]|nr:folate-binding protein YgfZ [Phycisphaerales bacterium]